ncbi:hypothetical protein Emag_003301 [Eimeria magna]
MDPGPRPHQCLPVHQRSSSTALRAAPGRLLHRAASFSLLAPHGARLGSGDPVLPGTSCGKKSRVAAVPHPPALQQQQQQQQQPQQQQGPARIDRLQLLDLRGEKVAYAVCASC